MFTGGSLLIGTAGRTDLLGADRTAELTGLQAASLRRLAALPAATRLLPTHGAGSFCSAGPATGSGESSLGIELASNPDLRAIDDGFADALIGGLGRFPDYYARMAPLNRAGPSLIGRPPVPPALDPETFAAQVARGVAVVDARPRDAFAAGHLPGSLNIEIDDNFAAYVGWLIPFDSPLLLVVAEPVAVAAIEAATELLRIGFDHVVGVLNGGVEAWAAAGRELRSYDTLSIRDLLTEFERGARPDILDVRQAQEWRDGIIPDSRTIFVADLPGRLGELPRDHQITVVCKGGNRASIAASILNASGIPVRLVARGGATGWVERFVAASAAR